MPNYTEHFIGGLLTGGFIYLGLKKLRNEPANIQDCLIAGLGSGLVATFPDEIDPPTGPTHRKIGHSIAGGIGLMALWNKIQNSPNLSQQQKDIFRSWVGGYGSHLLLDSQTPASLPLI